MCWEWRRWQSHHPGLTCLAHFDVSVLADVSALIFLCLVDVIVALLGPIFFLLTES